MQCEHCKKRKATVFYKENINGRTRSYQLCNDCATAMQQTGELEDMSILLESFASPMLQHHDVNSLLWGSKQPTRHTPAGKLCPVCGSGWEDIQRSGRVGCQTCYTTFATELSPVLRGVHGGATHVGRYPHTYRQKKEIQERVAVLKAKLAAAVSAQAFEQAVLLRDEIKALEGGL